MSQPAKALSRLLHVYIKLKKVNSYILYNALKATKISLLASTSTLTASKSTLTASKSTLSPPPFIASTTILRAF
jgi:hypothetical protein